MLYRIIRPLEEGVLVNYVGVHPVRVGHPPTVGFVETDIDENEVVELRKASLEMALWAKEQELLALAKKHELRTGGEPVEVVWYWDGKALAFADTWVMSILGTTDVPPGTYNKLNELWSERATKSLAAKGITLNG